MKQHTCQECRHFYQHYVVDDKQCVAIHCGHCTYPRLKNRRPEMPACDHFIIKDPPASIPWHQDVTQFLNSALVQYILSLDPPPDLQNESRR